MLSSPVTAQSPPQGLLKFGSGVNTFAVDRGLIGIRKRYAGNMEIFGDGEPAEYLYEVVFGLVRSCKTLDNGRRQITGFHMSGEVFGLELDDEHHLSAEAVGDAITLAVKRSAILGLAARDVYFARQLWAATARDLQRAQNHIAVLGCMNARQRVAAFLLVVPSSSVDHEIELPMSRRDIADYLGLTIETVSRTMMQLEKETVIDVPSARRIVLRDRGALTRVAVHDNYTAYAGLN
jgi:CRP/FNR family nitrogen fixation transcriptional regulator